MKKKKKSPPSHSLPHRKRHHFFKTISVTVWIGVSGDTLGSDWHTRCYNQPTSSVWRWWKVACGKMETTVRDVSCLPGTCFVIDVCDEEQNIDSQDGDKPDLFCFQHYKDTCSLWWKRNFSLLIHCCSKVSGCGPQNVAFYLCAGSISVKSLHVLVVWIKALPNHNEGYSSWTEKL